jgi:hypothetical protein
MFPNAVSSRPGTAVLCRRSTMGNGYGVFGNSGDFPKGKTLTLPKAVPGLILINYKSCCCGLTVSAPVFLTHKRHKALTSAVSDDGRVGENHMSELLECRERLESAHKQMQEAMTELITNKHYSEAERLLQVVDKLLLELIEDMGGTVIRSGLWT